MNHSVQVSNNKFSIKGFSYLEQFDWDITLRPSLSSHVSNIDEKNASLQQPQKIGHYSVNVHKDSSERMLMLDESNLSYLNLPEHKERICFDLTDGYDPKINWLSSSNCKLDELLRWILNNLKALSFCHNPVRPLDFDFITYRGTFTKIMVTPFVPREKWFIGASKFMGAIYLFIYPEDRQTPDDVDFDENNLFCYGGYRFEHYITRPANHNQIEDNNHSTLNEYAAVIKSKLKTPTPNEQISLLYAAEMDCLDTNQTDSSVLKNFVEIKTTRRMFNENQHRSFSRFKLIKWWAQSYLAGVEKIWCGYKEQHTVNQIQMFNVADIPYRCSEHWSRRQCINFLYQFLNHVQTMLKNEDNPFRLYLFSNNQANNQIVCRQTVSGNAASELSILPDWYVQTIQERYNAAVKKPIKKE